jgi:hypothetical protein
MFGQNRKMFSSTSTSGPSARDCFTEPFPFIEALSAASDFCGVVFGISFSVSDGIAAWAALAVCLRVCRVDMMGRVGWAF